MAENPKQRLILPLSSLLRQLCAQPDDICSASEVILENVQFGGFFVQGHGLVLIPQHTAHPS